MRFSKKRQLYQIKVVSAKCAESFDMQICGVYFGCVAKRVDVTGRDGLKRDISRHKRPRRSTRRTTRQKQGRFPDGLSAVALPRVCLKRFTSHWVNLNQNKLLKTDFFTRTLNTTRPLHFLAPNWGSKVHTRWPFLVILVFSFKKGPRNFLNFFNLQTDMNRFYF